MLTTPEAMKRMKLKLIADDAQHAALALAELGVLHPEVGEEDGQALDEFPALQFQEVFHRIQTRYQKIIDLHGERADDVTDRTLHATIAHQPQPAAEFNFNMEELSLLDGKVRELWARVSALEERLRQIRDERGSVSQLQASLQRFLALDVDLSRVGHRTRFLNVMAGTIDRANTVQLARALSLLGYILETFYSKENLDYVLIAGPTGDSDDVIELLRSADFRDLPIPGEFSDRPQQVLQHLNQRASELDRDRMETQREMQQVISHQVELLQQVAHLLYHAQPYARLGSYLQGKGRMVALEGWVPEARQQDIRRILDERLQYPYYLVFATPLAEEYNRVPTLLKSNPLLQPFQVLIRQYGLPRYCEFDPGALFAVSYILMFGMMFGDVGHGAVIALLSLALWRRIRVVAVIGGLAGMSSVIFGFLYGSVFGYEHVLHPLWMSPMQDPQYVLLLALYWGRGFLVVANLLAIRNLLVFGEFDQAKYSPQGISGLLFYLIAIYGLARTFGSGQELPLWVVVALSVLMSSMLHYLWRESSGQLVERIMVVLVEGLEIIITNVSATLSFLRVAAFTLNHIALAAAVFALAAMLDTVGHWIAIVLGNVFIIVLEGAIVAIQCLRLEYYEGFSRYFSGKGRSFEPLKTEFSQDS